MHFLNIVVCFYKHSDTDVIRNLLSHSGHRVAYSCISGSKALEACDKLRSGLVISGYRLTDMLCTELCENLPEGFDMLMLSRPSKRDATEDYGKMVLLDLPVRYSEFASKLSELEDAMERRRKQRSKSRRLGGKGRSEEDALAIDAAKSLLIEQRGYTEETAHRYLQRMAMSSGISLGDTARKYLYLSENRSKGQEI